MLEVDFDTSAQSQVKVINKNKSPQDTLAESCVASE